MTKTNRRAFLGGLAVAAGSLATGRAQAVDGDGHAAGYDVAASSEHLPLIPRRTGDPVTFTAALDKSPIKATSGGWAREITTKGLPIATDIAGAHLYLNPGGVREMHWHNSAEWAYILAGHCQVTVVDPEGETEIANYAPGDLWYFPKGHAHAIQTLGTEPCHAILAFDDGLYGEHGKFGLSDWLSRLDPGLLSQALGLPKDMATKIPTAEVYISAGMSSRAIVKRPAPRSSIRSVRTVSGSWTTALASLRQGEPFMSPPRVSTQYRPPSLE
jgi:oxalate decarboxylase